MTVVINHGDQGVLECGGYTDGVKWFREGNKTADYSTYLVFIDLGHPPVHFHMPLSFLYLLLLVFIQLSSTIYVFIPTIELI